MNDRPSLHRVIFFEFRITIDTPSPTMTHSRYDQCTFEQYSLMMADMQLLVNYHIWAAGFDYTISPHPQIEIGSLRHVQLRQPFMIYPCCKDHKRIHTFNGAVLFVDLMTFDHHEYLRETERMDDLANSMSRMRY